MQDFLEIIAVGFSATMFFSTVLGFVLFWRYINYKEKQVIQQYQKENSHE